MRCDTLILLIVFIIISFNPHTYMRCDLVCLLGRVLIRRFNPHTYMRCDCFSLHIVCLIPCFNPHTYMRCDFYSVNDLGRSGVVSIHTPTWGVTELNFQTKQEFQFQSTHLHEVWLLIVRLASLDKSFNPHTYMRCDIFEEPRLDEEQVSIHTPTWGVTSLNSLWIWLILFQSTHLHEVWPITPFLSA